MQKTKKKLSALDEAKANVWKHNKAMKEEQARIEAEEEEQTDLNDELKDLLTATVRKERRKAPVVLPGKIQLMVYAELTGEQEELLAKLTDIGYKAKKGEVGDYSAAIESAINLAASLVVHEDGRIWDKPKTWRTFFRQRDLVDLMDIISVLLQPYEVLCKQTARFRQKSRRKNPGGPLRVLPDDAEDPLSDDE
jgi:hypothetical protein